MKSVTPGRETDWLRAYNNSTTVMSDYVPLSQSDINYLVRKRLLSLDDLLVAYCDRTPSAVCRLVIDPKSANTLICDFCSSPGRPEGARNLIDHVIMQAREMKIALVGIWLEGISESLANLVSAFSFDMRRVRVRMDCTMMSAPARTTASSASPFLHSADGSPLIESDLEGRTTLRDLLDHSEMMWRESERLTTDQAVVNVYTSEKSPSIAWMLAKGQSPADQDRFTIEEQDLLAVMTRLYEKGIRHVRAETVPEYEVRRIFSARGFELKKRYFLLGLELLY